MAGNRVPAELVPALAIFLVIKLGPDHAAHVEQVGAQAQPASGACGFYFPVATALHEPHFNVKVCGARGPVDSVALKQFSHSTHPAIFHFTSRWRCVPLDGMALQWQYSRNQLRHWVDDGELYRGGLPSNSGFNLFEIRSNRDPMKIRSKSDLFRLLHKGRQVDSHRIVKVLKATAESIQLKSTTDTSP